MRVAIFFDGKNFYAGMQQAIGVQRLDFLALARWLVQRVEGSKLWGAYYYTGVEPGTPAEGSGQEKLKKFLDWLELQPGYFVYRFQRRQRAFDCRQCGADLSYSEEKEVDTTMVADVLRLAAVGAFDVMILVSGDVDYTPAIEGVRALGRQAYVASWQGLGLAERLRRAAFDHINLREGLKAFLVEPPAPAPRRSTAERVEDILRDEPPAADAGTPAETSADPPTEEESETFLTELQRAEESNRYVGDNYFVTKWRSDVLPASPEVRQRIKAVLEHQGKIERYFHPEAGVWAIRRVGT